MLIVVIASRLMFSATMIYTILPYGSISSWLVS